jgi:hypothetical protein
MMYARVNYEPFKPWTYHGIVVTDEKRNVVKRFSSGSFDDDFEKYKEWADHLDTEVILATSIENFILDRFSREYP